MVHHIKAIIFRLNAPWLASLTERAGEGVRRFTSSLGKT
jgi:hypothetical protein